MATLFQIAGGTLSAQDEEAASALNAAASAPPSINGPSMAFPGLSSISAFDNESSRSDKFSWVSGEDASGMSLDQMKSGAESLSPGELRATAEKFTTAAQTLGTAADQLLTDVQSELGSSWQGEFAETAQTNVALFHGSATELASQLTTVAERANALADGYDYTRNQIGSITPEIGADNESDAAAALEASREDAQRVIHSEYNPQLESANLSGLTFTPAHRVGSAGGTGIEGVSPVALWNREIAAPEGGTGVATRHGVDAATVSAASGNGGGVSAPAGGPGTPASSGSPIAAAASAPASGTSGVMPAGVGATPGGGARPSGTATASASRPGAGATAPARTGGTVRAGTGSTPGAAVSANGARNPSDALSSSSPGGRSAVAGGGTGGGVTSPRTPGTAGLGGSAARSASLPSTGGTLPGSAGAPGSAGSAPRAGVGTGLSSTAGAGGAPPTSASGAAGRVGGPMMGAMPMGAGSRAGDKSHEPADYLVHPSHSSELIGELPAAVQSVLRGKRSTAE